MMMKAAIVAFLMCLPVWGANDEASQVPKECGALTTGQIPADLLELAKLIVEKEANASDPALADVTASLRDTIATKRGEAKSTHSIDDATLDERLGVLVGHLQSGATLTASSPTTAAKTAKPAGFVGTVTPDELQMAEGAVKWAQGKQLAMGPALIEAVKEKNLAVVRGFTVLFHKREEIAKTNVPWRRFCVNWDPSRPDPEGKCSLHHAIEQKADDIGLALIEAGVEVELSEAVKLSGPAVALALIQRGKRIKLSEVIGKQPSNDVALKLIEVGVEPDADDLAAAITADRVEVATQILDVKPELLEAESTSRVAPLVASIIAKKPKLQSLFFERGAKFGQLEIINAFLRAQVDIARKILEREPTLVNTSMLIKVGSGSTAYDEEQSVLIIAVDLKHDGLIDLAIEYRVDVEFIPPKSRLGENALSRSIRVGTKAHFDKLMAANANPDGRQGADGITPVEMAIAMRKPTELADLIIAGADLSLKPSEKYKPGCPGYLELAKKFHAEKSAELNTAQSDSIYGDTSAKKKDGERIAKELKPVVEELAKIKTILEKNWSK